jgi:hypothetical protein
MRKEIKKYFSLVLLFLFLFPMVEKEVHAFEHSADEHCSTNEKHFHNLEHHCGICDFTLANSNELTAVYYQFVIPVKLFPFQPLIESIHIPGAFQNLPSRAPPVA